MMTYSIVLEVPENVYQGIVKEAETKKRKVEEIALERLAKDETQEIKDPFEKFIGTFDSGGKDWANRHDEDFEQLADKLADYFEKNLPADAKPLSDYAMSREGIYEDHP